MEHSQWCYWVLVEVELQAVEVEKEEEQEVEEEMEGLQMEAMGILGLQELLEGQEG